MTVESKTAQGATRASREGAARHALLVLGAVGLSLLGALAWAHAVGTVPVGLYTTDYGFLSEGARRIALGQTPHVDFSSPIGPMTLWLMALARHVPWLGPDVFAVNTLAWVLISVPVAATAFGLRTAEALPYLAVAALVTLAPFTLEIVSDSCAVNHNGVYNRHGAALLFAAMVAGFRPPRSRWLAASVFAVLIGAMLLVKITYALAGLAFLGLSCAFAKDRAWSLGAALAAVAAAALALEAVSGLTTAYGRDVAEMARLNSGGMAALIPTAMSTHALSLTIAAALVAVLAIGAVGPARHAWGTPALATACVALVLWTESQSTGGAGLVGLTALLLAPGMGEGSRRGLKLALSGALLAASVGVFAEQVVRRGRCVLAEAPGLRSHPALAAIAPSLMAAEGRLVAGEMTARFWRDEKPFAEEAYRKGFHFGLESHGAPIAFLASAILAEEAVRRFRQLGLDSGIGHTTSLTFQDEITPLLGLPPARGLKLVLDPFRTVGPMTAAEASAYLRPVDAVFERTCGVASWTQWLSEAFRPALTTFDPVVLTPCWTVHLPRKG